MTEGLHTLFQSLRRVWVAVRSDVACAHCERPERPWRRMMWYPFDGSSAGAYICSEACWDRFEQSVTWQ